MDFINAKPLEHKNQACFITPQVKATNFSNGNRFIDKGGSANSLLNTANLMIQKSSLLNGNNGQQEQPLSTSKAMNGGYNNQINNNNNYDQQTTTNGRFSYDTSKVKMENDSNESSYSDNNNQQSVDFRNFSHLKFGLHASRNDLSHQLNSDQQNGNNSIGNLSMANFHGFMNGNLLNGLNSLNGFNGFESLSNLSNLTSLKAIAQANQQNHHQQSVKRGSSRRPSQTMDKVSPEEEERRKLRRERNKEAAARCRKRRVEHTSKLESETQHLEEEQKLLKLKIMKMKTESDQLLSALKDHDCKLAHHPNLLNECK